MFQARQVTVGASDGTWYAITGGQLKTGDKVAAEGGYLIDSEARLTGGSAATGHQRQ